MSLFQTSVVKKYLSELSLELIDKKYNEFQTYFGNAERQENIRNSKEEEYQSGFINALFVNILGYTLNPEPNFNIVLEKKNVDDSKKADGAILKENEVIAVIELKSTQTTDLDTVETQAFGYKNHNPKCQYIITSNFEKIRLYIQNAIDHLEFDLFNLSREDFALLWLCFVKDNVLQDIPLKIKESSVLQEENVTKQLYKDYSKFRKEIFENIVKNNPEFDKLVLFKKTQKLLDRFLFIFFAEDRLLLPPNSISEIVKQWTTLKEDLDEYIPLYERFKKYFGYLNTGFKGKKYDIFAYNGGLFLVDEILDNIKIDDEVLHHNTVQLSTYDFETDVDVNILGHIFEHSLSEIENVQAEIAGEVVEKQKTKRKKDGIFYTPKYITKYIVENTVGKLCEEKRNEFGIIDEEYAKGRKNRKKDIVRALDDKLTAYSDWLIEITILDPACGSGAFLNQALEFLIQEHKKIDELKAQLLGGSIVFPDIEAKILEKNIYGVDLNEESVEIAKLSLWLRTAQKGRKLTTLSNHIKCGNSLIDDPEIAGEKAFNWQNEFPQVFTKGGFDVVIGNPPYVRVQNLNYAEIDYYKENYLTAHKRIDISLLFFEKGLKIVKDSGLLAYISTIQFLNAEYGRKFREFLLTKQIVEFIDYNGLPVFEGATTYPGILFLKNSMPNKFKYSQLTKVGPEQLYANDQSKTELIINPIDLTDEVWVLSSKNKKEVLNKIQKDCIRLKEIANPCTGLTSGSDSVFILTEEEVKTSGIEKDIILPVVRGRNLLRGYVSDKLDYVLYPYELIDNKTELISEHKLKSSYPNAYSYLLLNKDTLIGRKDSRKDLSNQTDWYKLIRKGKLDLFKSKKILTPGISKNNRFAIDTKGMTYLCGGAGVFGLVQEKLDNDVLLAILNSKVVEFFMHSISTKKQGSYYSYLNRFLEEIPIPIHIDEKIKEYSIKYQDNQYKLVQLSDKFIDYMMHNVKGVVLTGRLHSWYKLKFGEFISELNKAIKKGNGEKLSKMDEMEWMEVFESKKAEAQTLKFEINKTDKEIDQIVYELYSLTEEEIKIIEEKH